jgi:leader peptidase (prepilin peptidase)/N-methyltransferase
MIYVFLIGLAFGSFINALVWRLSEQLDSAGNRKKLSKTQKKDLSIVTGHSMCPNCQHRLAAKDLIPVFSWLMLKGRCRYCHKPISIQYPAVELTTASLFALSYAFWPYTLDGNEWFIFTGYLVALICLIAMAVYDIKYTILPSRLIYIAGLSYALPLLLVGLIDKDNIRFGMAVLSGVLYFAIFFSIFIASYWANKKGLSGKDWLGYGDVRLAFLLGLIVGDPILVFFAIFFASLIGIIVTLPSMLSKKVGLTSQIPFGPFLIAGAIVTFWWGDYILNWYSSSILGL